MKRNRGFTLIELLTVISIIGLLASIVLANIQNAKDKAKTAAAAQFDASTRHVLGDSTVGSWEFDEGGGTVAYDSSGNGNNGTLGSGVSYDLDTYNGQGYSLYFNGDKFSHIDGVASIQNPGANGQITITSWVNPTGIVNPGTIFTGGTGGTCNSFGATLGAGGLIKAESSGYGQKNASTIKLTPNAWQHLALVYNGTTVTSYINGKFAGNVTSGTSDCGGATSLSWTIAQDISSAGSYFKGKLDGVRVYGQALASGDIEKIYALETQKRLAQKDN